MAKTNQQKKTESKPEVTAEAVDQTTASEMPSISLVDIKNVANIIRVASTRGAFKADELTAVGSTYDRINAFLTWNEKQQAENAEAEKEETK